MSVRSRVRRWAPWVVLAVAAATLATLLSGTPSGEPLGPDNPGRDGAQALAHVLADQGVDVRPVRGTAALAEAQVGPGTTVLVTHTAYLSPEAGAELLERTRDADRLVVVVPDAQSTPGAALGLDVDVNAGGGQPVAADCDAEIVRPDEKISSWDVQLEATGADRATVTACYPPTVGHGAGGAKEGALLTFPATAERPTVTLVGLGGSLTNVHVTQDANAATGLRLLGGSPELLWVIPQPGDSGEAAPQSLWDVLPRSMTAVVVLLGAAALALSVWRGRRLGPVVTEPLPAVVHAGETTRNRGRLYRQAGDRQHALAALRVGTHHRLALRLGLPAGTDPEQLVDAVADATGRPVEEVRRLLAPGGTDGTAAPAHAAAHTPTTVPDDATLVTTARELRSLEEGLHP